MTSGSSPRKGAERNSILHRPKAAAARSEAEAWLGPYQAGVPVWSENSGPASTLCAVA